MVSMRRARMIALFVFVVLLALSSVLVTGCAAEADGSSGTSTSVPWDEARGRFGETLSVQGPVVSTHFAATSNGQPTFLNLGVDYPDQGRLQVVIFGDARGAFSVPPEAMYEGKTIVVTGTVEDYKGVSEIIVDSPDDIAILD